ncbi:MAG: methionyl-tRNA formyltransferase [Rickettsiales bacterium]|jgi:methionyl-tRNA formyltransferase|nr:methionyl-tRNA formyltransferase [Rickettsiales bacterium]
MKIVFFASAEFAIPTLNNIYNSHHEICAVYTREPREAGRGLDLQKTPIHNRALELGLMVKTPKTLKKEKYRKILKSYGADIFVVVAFGLLLPKEILNIAKYSCINIHPSLLPRWRGAAPLQRALLNGDKETGVCVITLGEGLDDGDILACEKVEITKNTTLETLHDDLSLKGANLMLQVLDKIEKDDKVIGIPQNNKGLTYANKIEKEESKLNFDKSAEHNFNIIRTIGGYFEYNSERIKILKAEYEILDMSANVYPNFIVNNNELRVKCGDGFLIPLLLQRESKKPLSTEEFLRGFKFE